MSTIWNNSLSIIGILGVLVLILSYFLDRNIEILMFGHLLVIAALSVLFFMCYMLILRGNGRNMAVVLIMLGAGGRTFMAIGEIMSNQVISKPPLTNMSIVILILGVISILNTLYNDQNDGCQT